MNKFTQSFGIVKLAASSDQVNCGRHFLVADSKPGHASLNRVQDGQ